MTGVGVPPFGEGQFRVIAKDQILYRIIFRNLDKKQYLSYNISASHL